MNFVSAVQTLVDADVEFVIIGGWSAILHGSSNTTNDLDICFSRQGENLKRLARALAPFHPRLRDLPASLPFTLSTDVGIIHLLAQVSGVGDFPEVKAHSELIQAFDRSVWTLDLPSLIRAKRAAGREKDLRVLPELPELESLLEAQKPE